MEMQEIPEVTAGLHPCPPVNHKVGVNVQVQAQPVIQPGNKVLISLELSLYFLSMCYDHLGSLCFILVSGYTVS